MKRTGRVFFCRNGDVTYSTDGNFMYAEKDGETVRLDLFDRHYYKLKPYNGVPVLEVDGLRMQLVRDFKTPLDYANGIVKRLRMHARPGSRGATVLDTCMGLGYTAIAAAKNPEVKRVITCEVSPAVVTLAKWNPFSDALWEKDSRITVLEGSIAELIRQFDDRAFSFVIHDPPRFSHAPELYSLEFYKELHRVCEKGARIFHYVGSVGKGKGRHIDREVSERLAAAGFLSPSYSACLQGIFASK
ncbi:MAG: SAM-dependent methyltransferase [Candidatus ainarchaeum sp.]|nr:SAM-dependent methyltransferase [Candidatus ainarchaeum sp.]